MKVESVSSPKLKLSEPVIISQAPPDIRNWGKWQFPGIHRLPDGRLQVNFHMGADSATAYGSRPGSYISTDEGRTWLESKEETSARFAKIFKLPNGDWFQQKPLVSLPLTEISSRLPEPIAFQKNTYTNDEYSIYSAADMPSDLQGWRFLRRPGGTSDWVEEQADVRIPGEVYWSVEGVLARPKFWRIRMAPDGSLWAPHYARRIVDGSFRGILSTMFLRSTDFGRTWNWVSEIPYQPDQSADPLWEKRQGFTEPDLTFLPDGSLFCLMRTTDGHGTGPCYGSRSTDGGQTWSEAKIFDDLGVWPALVTLKNGVTLASYGRPGLYLRATSSADASQWGERVMLVGPDPQPYSTCAYSDMIAMDDNSAMIAYSDFYIRDEEDRPRKTILVRKITVEN